LDFENHGDINPRRYKGRTINAHDEFIYFVIETPLEPDEGK